MGQSDAKKDLAYRLNPNNLSVRAALIQAAVWVVMGNLAVLVAYLIAGQIERSALSASRDASLMRQEVDQVYAEIYQLAAVEERILRLTDLSLVAEHSSILTSAQSDVSHLVESMADEPELAREAEAIYDTLLAYERTMNELVRVQEVVGVSQDTGLIGQLGAASTSVEYNTNATSNDRLMMFHRRLQGAERGYLQSRNPDFKLPFEKAHERFSKLVDGSTIDANIKMPLQKDLVTYLDVMSQLIDQEQQLSNLLGELKGLAADIPPRVAEIRSQISDKAAAAVKRSDDVRFLANLVVIALSVGVATILISGFIWLIRRIAPPLREAAELCRRVAEGDLTMTIASDRNDEIGDLLRALGDMTDHLSEVIQGVRESAEVIQSGATEISSANSYLSQRTEESAASLEETASSMEQMTATVRQNADNAKSASNMAVQAERKAEDGGVVVGEAVSSMDEIIEASREVEKVISVVNEIAFQTNLLALNAAVESARAGEAGRGFAVVAAEVRVLAQRSADAAQRVRELITTSTEKVEAGTSLVNRAGQVLSDIQGEVRQVSRLVQEINSAGQEQSEGIGQVNTAVLDMDRVTQQNAAMVEEAASAAKSMEEQAQEMLAR